MFIVYCKRYDRGFEKTCQQMQGKFLECRRAINKMCQKEGDFDKKCFVKFLRNK